MNLACTYPDAVDGWDTNDGTSDLVADLVRGQYRFLSRTQPAVHTASEAVEGFTATARRVPVLTATRRILLPLSRAAFPRQPLAPEILKCV